MAQDQYTPGSVGQQMGYNLTPQQAQRQMAAGGRPLYPQFRNGASLVQLDLVIVNSMTTALQIELFNYFRSQTRQYNAQNQVNDYYPLGIDTQAGQPGATNGTYVNANIRFASTTTNGYVNGLFKGAYNSYVNASNSTPVLTKKQVFFDIYGNMVLQPGYVDSVLTTGNVIVSVNQMPYLQLFEFSSDNKFIIDCSKYTFNAQAQTSQMQSTVYHKFFSSVGVATNTENYTPATFFNEGNFQSNIITVPVDKKMTPQWGMWYQVLGQQSGVNTQVTMTMFLWIDNDALMTDSNPRN